MSISWSIVNVETFCAIATGNDDSIRRRVLQTIRSLLRVYWARGRDDGSSMRAARKKGCVLRNATGFDIIEQLRSCFKTEDIHEVSELSIQHEIASPPGFSSAANIDIATAIGHMATQIVAWEGMCKEISAHQFTMEDVSSVRYLWVAKELRAS